MWLLHVNDYTPVLTMRCCFGHDGFTITPRAHSLNIINTHTHSHTIWSVSRIQCPFFIKQKQLWLWINPHETERTGWFIGCWIISFEELKHFSIYEQQICNFFAAHNHYLKKYWTRTVLTAHWIGEDGVFVYDLIECSVYLKWEIIKWNGDLMEQWKVKWQFALDKITVSMTATPTFTIGKSANLVGAVSK